jgi:hypothetical protein
MHFTRHSTFEGHGLGHSVPIITKGEGLRSGTTGATSTSTPSPGCSSPTSATAAPRSPRRWPSRPSELAFFPLWSYAHPRAIELAERLAHYAPGDLNRVFFTTGGGEAVESAWKLAKQYFKLTGKPTKHKVISRSIAYHGTPQGALSITGIPAAKSMFEPLVPGGHKVPNTNIYRAPEHLRDDEKAFGRWAADRIAEAIEFEGPETVAAVFLEPVQNSGGCFPPPPGYFERVREICDEYDVLLVSDETICAFGRIGSMFACDDLGYVPDIITTAKGITQRLRPAGPDDRQRPALRAVPHGTTYFPHGYTWGGHPVSARPRWPTSTSSSARASTTRQARTPRSSAHPGAAARPADRRRRPRGRLLLRHRAGQGQGHPRDLRRRRERAPAARLPVQGALRRRAVLPGRRPRRPRRSSSLPR